MSERRYLPGRIPGTATWGVYDTDTARFLPNPESESEAEDYAFEGYPHANQWAIALNNDPLGHEERLRRESKENVSRAILLMTLDRWCKGEKTDAELRAARDRWADAGHHAEEGLNIQ